MNMWKSLYSPYYQVEIPSAGGIIVDNVPVLVRRPHDRRVVIRRGRYRVYIEDNRIVAISPKPEHIWIWRGDIVEKLDSSGSVEIIPVTRDVSVREERVVRVRRSGKTRDKWKVLVTRYKIVETVINVAGLLEFRDVKRMKISETSYRYSEAEKLGLV